MFDRNILNLVSISFLGGILGNGLMYLLNLSVGRGLGPEALGYFSFGFVILNLANLSAKVGLDKAVRKFVPVYNNSGDEGRLAGLLVLATCVPIALGSVIAVTLYTSSDLISQVSSQSFSTVLIPFLIGIPFMAVMSVGRAATTGFIHTRYAVYIKDICQSGSAILFVLFAIVVFESAAAAAAGYTLSLILAAFLSLYYLYKLGGFAGISDMEIESTRIIVYSLPLTLAAVSQYLVSWTDVLMLGALNTAGGVGQYQAAFQTAMILGFLLIAANQIFPSIASSLYDSGELNRLRDVYAVVTKWITFFTALAFVFAVIYAEEILLLFGAEFTAARTVFLLLAGVYLFTTAVGPAGNLLMMADYERIEMANTIVAALSNVILNYVLIVRYGVLGAGMATGAALCLLNLLRLGEVWWFLQVRPSPGDYWKGFAAIVATTPVMLLGQLFEFHYLVVLVASGTISLGFFLVVLYLLGIDERDRLLVESLAT